MAQALVVKGATPPGLTDQGAAELPPVPVFAPGRAANLMQEKTVDEARGSPSMHADNHEIRKRVRINRSALMKAVDMTSSDPAKRTVAVGLRSLLLEIESLQDLITRPEKDHTSAP